MFQACTCSERPLTIGLNARKVRPLDVQAICLKHLIFNVFNYVILYCCGRVSVSAYCAIFSFHVGFAGQETASPAQNVVADCCVDILGEHPANQSHRAMVKEMARTLKREDAGQPALTREVLGEY